MPDFDPTRPYEGEWPATDPLAAEARQTAYIPEGSITDSKVQGIGVRKIQGIGLKAYRSTDQSGIVDSTDTSITFDTVVFNEGFTAPAATFTSVTAPYPGVYLIVVNIEWENATVNDPQAFVAINGAKAEGSNTKEPVSPVPRENVTAVRLLAQGDTIGAIVRHTSGANRTVNGGADNISLSAVMLFSI